MLPLRAIRGLRNWLLIGAIFIFIAGCNDFLLSQGLDAYRAHDLVKAKQKFNRVVERNPTNWKGHYYLGLIALDEGVPHVAQSELEVTYTLRGKGPPQHPETPQVADALAEAIYRQDNYVRLMGFCDEVIQTFGTVDDYLRKARYLVKIGDNDAAETAYLTAIRIQPREADHYMELAAFYESLGKHDKAVVRLRQAYGLTDSEKYKQELSQRIYGYGLEAGAPLALPPDGE